MANEGAYGTTPAEIALIVAEDVDRPKALIAAARAAGALIIHVRLTEDGELPWQGRNLPGSEGGCALLPEAGSNEVRVVTDRDGVFFASTIAVVLRSHAIRSLVLVGDLPASFTDCVAHFAKQRGYALVRPGAWDATELEAVWRKSGHGRDGDLRSGELLSTLADRIDPRHA